MDFALACVANVANVIVGVCVEGSRRGGLGVLRSLRYRACSGLMCSLPIIVKGEGKGVLSIDLDWMAFVVQIEAGRHCE